MLRAGALVVCALSATAGTLQSRQSAPPTPFSGLPLEASGVVSVPGSRGVLIAADSSEREVFWMELDDRGVGRPVVPVPIGATIVDPEDITTDGTYIYVIGSQSRGGRNIDGLVRFQFDPASRRVTRTERVTGLETLLFAAVPDLRRLSRGRSGPLNIEGMTWDGARQRLLIGLRSPLVNGRAVVIAARVGDASRPLSAANFVIESEIVQLDLGGSAIRGLGYDAASSRVLIIGGGSTDVGRGTFKLFDWDGSAKSPVRALADLRDVEKPEGVTRITVGGRARTLIVFDLGGYSFVN
jgi:hypothetical protein